MLIELNESGLVVGIDNKETTARLVALAAEPCLDVVYNLAAKMQVLVAMVHTKTAKQHGWEVLARLLCVNLCAYHVAPPPRDVAGENAGISHGDSPNDAFWRTVAEEIGLAEHLPLVTLYVVVKEIIDVLASAVELLDAVGGDISKGKPQTIVDIHAAYFFKLS